MRAGRAHVQASRPPQSVLAGGAHVAVGAEPRCPAAPHPQACPTSCPCWTASATVRPARRVAARAFAQRAAAFANNQPSFDGGSTKHCCRSLPATSSPPPRPAGKFFLLQFPQFSILLAPLEPLLRLYFSVPFASLVVFFGIYLVRLALGACFEGVF